MHRVLVPFAIFVFSTGVTGCGPPDATMTESQIVSTTQSVLRASQRMRKASSLGDWDTMGSFYSDSPQFRFYENGRLQYASAQDVRAALSAMSSGTTIVTGYTETEVNVLSSKHATIGALYRSHYSDSTGITYEWSGVLSVLWVQEEDGWRILSGHSSALQSATDY